MFFFCKTIISRSRVFFLAIGCQLISTKDLTAGRR